MCVTVVILIVSLSCHLFEDRFAYSRVVGERCLQVLGQPLEVVPKFLEFAVGHRHDVRKDEVQSRGRFRGRPWRPGEKLLVTIPRKWYGMRCRLRRRRRRFDAARTRRNPYWFLRGERRALAHSRGWTGVGSRGRKREGEREKESEGECLAAYSRLTFIVKCNV